MTESVIRCVGIVVLKGESVLLIKRGRPPGKGDWSIPGGKLHENESEQDGALRELTEETRCSARIIAKIDDIPAHFDGIDYMLHDYAAIWEHGTPIAGDDADEAVFVHKDKVGDLVKWDKTLYIIVKAFALRDAKNT